MSMTTETAAPTNGKAKHVAFEGEREIEIALIERCPTQPRRTFEPNALKDLADDIKLHGVLQGILVRPHPTKKGFFELVIGERRWRASTLAGLTMIPARVRRLSDVEVLEIQIVENAKRADIHPLEEADAYQALHVKHKFTIVEIAAKVGKSVATISARLRLCALGDRARAAFLAGHLSAAVALVVVSVPAGARQDQLVKELVDRIEVNDDPPTRGDVLNLVRHKFRLALADASFDRTDVTLVKGAPACEACPKRTGAQRDLFGETTSGEDICLDLTCFDSKKEAAWKKRSAALSENERVLPVKEAKKVFNGSSVAYNANYVALDDGTYVQGKRVTFGARLGAEKRKELEIVVARDENGRTRELVAKAEFAKAVPKSGVVAPKASSAKASHNDASDAKAWAKKQRERQAKEAAKEKADAELAAGVVKAVEKVEPNEGFWRVLLRAVIRRTHPGGKAERAFFEALGIKAPRGATFHQGKKIQDQVFAAVTRLKPARARALIVQRLVSSDHAGETIADFAELYGVQAVPQGEVAPPAKPTAKRPTAKKKARK